MRELLERWSRLEPERCSVGALSGWVTLSGTERSVPPTTMLASERALLLAAVIEAIEARGWWWKVKRNGPRPHLIEAQVGSSSASARPRADEAHEPAAALLGAYLAALEAEAGQ